MPIQVSPTRYDIEVANFIAKHAEPAPEFVARSATYGADEKLLIALAGALWIYSREQKPSLRLTANHILAVTLASALLPHLLKRTFNQTRPDRYYLSAHRRGVPISGNAEDAFPSGHAVHMGALASAATALPPKYRDIAWTATLTLALSRIVILAHWTSDVVVGFAIGATIERLIDA
jgi:membrane-associated phospholipid phosphatase